MQIVIIAFQFLLSSRLCSLTITRLSLLTPLPADLSSLSLAVKMQSSKRTLRSHEIPVPLSALQQPPAAQTDRYTTVTDGRPGGLASGLTSGSGMQSVQHQGGGPVNSGANAPLSATNSCGAFGSLGATGGGANVGAAAAGGGGGGGSAGGVLSSGGGGGGGNGGGSGGNSQPALLETDLDLHFSLQYPHFIKRDGNR